LLKLQKKRKKIIAVSNTTKEEIVDHLKVNDNKVAVIYEGVDHALRTSRNAKAEIKGKYFLYVGNAYPHKNIERLILAFEMLDKDIKLVLVGKEDYFYKRLIAKLKGKKISKKIIF